MFAIDHDRVLRLYRNGHEAPRQTAAQLQALYQSWRASDIGLELPLIIEDGRAQRAVLHRGSPVLGS